MRRHKVSCLPEEPLKNACVARMSVAENMAFRDFDREPFAAGGWWLRHGEIRAQAERKIASYQIKTAARTRRSAISRAATCSAPCWRASSVARSM